MAYTPTKWQQIKNYIKSRCTELGKKNKRFKKVYDSMIHRKIENRFSQYSDLPIDDKLVIFESFMGRRYSDSPRAIYEYMLI